MNRLGVIAAAGGAVAVGLAPVVPLLVAHDHDAFAVPTVPSTTATAAHTSAVDETA